MIRAILSMLDADIHACAVHARVAYRSPWFRQVSWLDLVEDPGRQHGRCHGSQSRKSFFGASIPQKEYYVKSDCQDPAHERQTSFPQANSTWLTRPGRWRGTGLPG